MWPPPTDGRTPAFPPRVGRAIGIGCASLIIATGALALIVVFAWLLDVLI